jgi:hypothetical protein
MPASTEIPYKIKTRSSAVVTTAYARTFRYGSAVSKLRTYYEIPAFSVENVWRGASEIIYRFDFPIGLVSLLNKFPITPPAGTNFCAVVAWMEEGEEFFNRYKLWENVGEILWLPLYNREKINASEFYIEIWNTDTSTGEGVGLGIETGEGLGIEFGGFGLGLEGAGGSSYDNLLLEEPIQLFTSRLVLPSGYCPENDVSLGEPTTCVDPVFDLDDFEPLYGDYYLLVAPCTRLLVKGTSLQPATGYNILQSSDETWHYVWFTTVDDIVTLYVDQSDAVPPPDALGYFPMIDPVTRTVHKINLEVIADGPPAMHSLHIDEQMPTDTDGRSDLIILENQDDALLYRFHVATVDGVRAFRVLQTPYTP